jgi:hypothetical protein
MTTFRTLSAMPYAQATVVMYDNNFIGLRSYQTLVAMIDADGWLTVRGLYSATTRRHIGCFVKEYANIDYQTAKMLCNDGMEYNIHTGEVRNLF